MGKCKCLICRDNQPKLHNIVMNIITSKVTTVRSLNLGSYELIYRHARVNMPRSVSRSQEGYAVMQMSPKIVLFVLTNFLTYTQCHLCRIY